MYIAAGVLVLFADIWAITRTVRSTASTNNKIMWIAIVLLLPFAGMVLWILSGPS